MTDPVTLEERTLTLIARLQPDGSVVTDFCPHCRRQHRHGRGLKPGDEIVLGAHCPGVHGQRPSSYRLRVL